MLFTLNNKLRSRSKKSSMFSQYLSDLIIIVNFTVYKQKKNTTKLSLLSKH